MRFSIAHRLDANEMRCRTIRATGTTYTMHVVFGELGKVEMITCEMPRTSSAVPHIVATGAHVAVAHVEERTMLLLVHVTVQCRD